MVRVLFGDAHSFTELTEEELPAFLKLAPYEAVGFKIAENKDTLIICQAILPKEKDLQHDETFFRQVLCIPKKEIQGIWELQEK
jgi:hypothetical protein